MLSCFALDITEQISNMLETHIRNAYTRILVVCWYLHVLSYNCVSFQTSGQMVGDICAPACS